MSGHERKSNVSILRDGCGRRHTYLRVSLTDRCNLRCRYCMPPEGIEHRPRSEVLSHEEILRLLEIFAELGIRKVRFTGGEPLIRRGLTDLVRCASSIPGIERIGLTTNGVLLDKYASRLREAGLGLMNVSLDTLRRDRYEKITGADRLREVLNGIAASLEAGFEVVKINVVVMAGVNDDEAQGFIRYFKRYPVAIRFIEFMPFGSNGWSEAGLIPSKQLQENLTKEFNLVELGMFGVAREYSVEGAACTVGFISPVTDHFCGGCNRLRLTADGSLNSCLFRRGEASLRNMLRNEKDDSAIAEEIRSVVAGKLRGHPGLDSRAAGGTHSESMAGVGG